MSSATKEHEYSVNELCKFHEFILDALSPWSLWGDGGAADQMFGNTEKINKALAIIQGDKNEQ